MSPPPKYLVGCYERLSREDGDKLESDSILNQHNFNEDFCVGQKELCIVRHYVDDGYTGTNFQRPGFRELMADIEAGRINCVVVKDLSRFGRDYIDMGFYLERTFPEKGVRFIAINDHVDSLNGPYDMMLPLKNVFNAQYAKDISDKVRSSFKAKQRRGEFVGAFSCYGYLKDPENHTHLVLDPVAAKVVQRIFTMAAAGVGQVRIAKVLNEEHIPCPSAYKKLMGMKYTNGHRLETTTYWTYATIHRMLRNEMYLGNMVQARSIRPTMHGKAKRVAPENWMVVNETHEAIISKELWDSVQSQMAKNSRESGFNGNVGLFAGFLKCADCGRAMSKTTWAGRITYSCGSYHRYGKSVCSPHYIAQADLEAILLTDLNRIINAVTDLKHLAEESRNTAMAAAPRIHAENCLRSALERIRRLKKNAYEDYREQLLSKAEFLRYKADYDRQEQTLQQQLDACMESKVPTLKQPWVDNLLTLGHLTELDRMTLAQTVKEIRIYEGKHIEITYLFSRELDALLCDTLERIGR